MHAWPITGEIAGWRCVSVKAREGDLLRTCASSLVWETKESGISCEVGAKAESVYSSCVSSVICGQEIGECS